MPLTFNWKYCQKGLDSCDNGYFGYGLDCCERLLFANITNITTTFDLYSLDMKDGLVMLTCATDKRQYLSGEISDVNGKITESCDDLPHVQFTPSCCDVTSASPRRHCLWRLCSVYSIHGTLTAEASLDEIESHGRHYKRIASSIHPRVHYECERCILTCRLILHRRSYAWKVEWDKNTVCV